MLNEPEFGRQYLEVIIESLDIPQSLYARAANRHRSLAEWLCRPGSRLREFNPHVSSQGSFRLGTVVRPLVQDAVYDLDNVTTLMLHKAVITQKQLKEVYGLEIADYAKANDMIAAPEEKNRCWRLPYADEVKFHLDSLPSLAEEETFARSLHVRNVPEAWAKRAIAITDKRHPAYAQQTMLWPTSNPRGFARWLESRMGTFADTKRLELVQRRFYATVEAVPTYELKTPLQRAIQLLKRHRDVMFVDNPDVAPISMIITNLAGHAYGGEADVLAAVRGILARMLTYVRTERPHVPNPTHPDEDYADKWAKAPELELYFRQWHSQAVQDFNRLPALMDAAALRTATSRSFRVDLRDAHLQSLGLAAAAPAIIIPPSAPRVQISSPARPWGGGD
ncbi:MAG: cyclic GMP-AMP synthase DncV-like nucleotidyltransferase [Vicinamibacterales bacterium]